MKPITTTVTSAFQQRAWIDRTVPAPEEVAPGLWMVALPMPGDGMPYSFSYAKVGDDGVYILDPGWGDPANVDAWAKFLWERGRTLSDIVMLLVTHGHPDHIGLSDSLRELTGAELVMSRVEARILGGEVQTILRDIDTIAHRLARWGVPDETAQQMLAGFRPSSYPAAPIPDRLIDDGDVIEFGGLDLTALLTPGHTGGHMCFIAREVNGIITGDHVLPNISPGLGLGATPGSDPVYDYVLALERMGRFDDYEVLPGHEYRFRGLAARSEQIAAHHLRRTVALGRIEVELGAEATVWEYASRVPWSRGWENLEGFMLHSALTQTELQLGSLRTGALDRWLRGDWAMHS